MELLFLGTSSGTPTRARNVSGLAVIEPGGKGWYLVDCGEGTQHQLLRTPLSLHDLRAIFVTHVHGDHCYGLPGLLASAGLSGRQAALEIIAPDGIEAFVRTSLALSHTHLPYELVFHRTETLALWRSAAVTVDIAPLSHRVPSFAYGFTEARPDPRLDVERLDREGIVRGPLWGQLARGQTVMHDGRVLQGDNYLLPTRTPRRLVVAGDNDRPELLKAACAGAQALVHEATFTQAVLDRAREARQRADFGHSTAASVAAFAERAGVPNLVLTHFSARYQADPSRSPSIEDIRQEAATSYGGRLFLAEDFARYRLGKDGVLARD